MKLTEKIDAVKKLWPSVKCLDQCNTSLDLSTGINSEKTVYFLSINGFRKTPRFNKPVSVWEWAYCYLLNKDGE